MKAMPRNITSLCLLLWLTFGCAVKVSASSARNSRSSGSVPIIDIRSWTQPLQFSDEERQSTADAVGQACREIGFFAITGHNLSLEVIEKAWSETAAFFDLPAEEKLKMQSSAVASYPYGYEQSERLSVGKQQQHSAGSKRDGDVVIEEDVPPDLKETFSIGPSNPQSGMPPRRFPAHPPDFADALDAYYREMEQLAGILLQIFAVALKLPRDWFHDKMDHHMSALRVLNYFPVHPTSSSTVAGGQGEGRSAARTKIRASAHTDYGALTILKSGGPGLQVKKDDKM